MHFFIRAFLAKFLLKKSKFLLPIVMNFVIDLALALFNRFIKKHKKKKSFFETLKDNLFKKK